MSKRKRLKNACKTLLKNFKTKNNNLTLKNLCINIIIPTQFSKFESLHKYYKISFTTFGWLQYLIDI